MVGFAWENKSKVKHGPSVLEDEVHSVRPCENVLLIHLYLSILHGDRIDVQEEDLIVMMCLRHPKPSIINLVGGSKPFFQGFAARS